MSFTFEGTSDEYGWNKIVTQIRKATSRDDIIDIHEQLINVAVDYLHKYEKFEVAAAAIALPNGAIRPTIGPRHAVEAVEDKLSLRELPEPYRINTQFVVALANGNETLLDRTNREVSDWMNSVTGTDAENQQIVNLIHAAWVIGVQSRTQAETNLKSKFSMN